MNRGWRFRGIESWGFSRGEGIYVGNVGKRDVWSREMIINEEESRVRLWKRECVMGKGLMVGIGSEMSVVC